MKKVVSMDEAVSHIRSGSTLAINGFVGMYPDETVAALEKRFLESGEPKGLTLYAISGQGSRGKHQFSDRLIHPGMLKRVVQGHWEACQELTAMAMNEEIEAYNLPLGVLSHLVRAAAGRKPAIISEVGLKTFVDPRQDGGKLNKCTTESLNELITLDGKDYILYKTPKIDVAIIRATTADAKGNITMEKEATFLDALTLAQAAKANGGIVIVQVERVTESRAKPQDVVIPFIAVDYIVTAPNQSQTWVEKYNPAYCGETVMPQEMIGAHISKLMGLSAGVIGQRSLEDWVIARRGAMELTQGAVINLGMGIPSTIGTICDAEGVTNETTLTVESGPIGGVPAKAGSFGASVNPDALVPVPTQFDFYDGGILDETFVGAAQVDPMGNVNVSKVGKRVFGVGGFVNITQNAKKVVFLTAFSGKGLKTKFEDGKLQIINEGAYMKFVPQISQISFSGEVAAENGQPVLYITERCVFRLCEEGLELIEIAPGIDPQKDILDKLAFPVKVAEELAIMDAKLFDPNLPLGLKELWENQPQ